METDEDELELLLGHRATPPNCTSHWRSHPSLESIVCKYVFFPVHQRPNS